VGDILILECFQLLKIQINSKKIRFWKEKSVENVVTLEGRLTIQFKHDALSYLAVQTLNPNPKPSLSRSCCRGFFAVHGI
jgi:hypothetical protein